MAEPRAALAQSLQDAERLGAALQEHCALLTRRLQSAKGHLQSLERTPTSTLLAERAATRTLSHDGTQRHTQPVERQESHRSYLRRLESAATVGSSLGTSTSAAILRASNVGEARTGRSHQSVFSSLFASKPCRTTSNSVSQFAVRNQFSIWNMFSKPPSTYGNAARLSEFPGMQYARRYIHPHLKEPPRSGRLYDIMTSDVFNALRTLVIIANATTASIQLNFAIQNNGSDELPWIGVTEFSFMIFYTIEVLLKLIIHRKHYFINDEASWNNFDLALVLLGLYDIVMKNLEEGSGGNLAFARLARVLRFTKLLRIFRAFKFVAPLRQMLGAITHALATLFWALVVLMLIWWTLALLLLQGFTAALSEGLEGEGLEGEKAEDLILLKFGSVPRAILTIFSLSTGGENWTPFYHLARIGGDFYAFVLVSYMFFFFIYLFNVLTAIVVDQVVAMAWVDEREKVFRFRQKKALIAQQLKELFEKMDYDMSGSISESEFLMAMSDPEILALMDENNVELRDATLFYKMLNAASPEEGISTAQFIDGFMLMRGGAQGVDMQIVIHQARQLLKSMREQRKELRLVKTLLQRFVGPLGRHEASEVSVFSRGALSEKPGNLSSHELPTVAEDCDPNHEAPTVDEQCGHCDDQMVDIKRSL